MIGAGLIEKPVHAAQAEPMEGAERLPCRLGTMAATGAPAGGWATSTTRAPRRLSSRGRPRWRRHTPLDWLTGQARSTCNCRRNDRLRASNHEGVAVGSRVHDRRCTRVL